MMRILFAITFVALLAVSWTHPVINERATRAVEIARTVVETRSFDVLNKPTSPTLVVQEKIIEKESESEETKEKPLVSKKILERVKEPIAEVVLKPAVKEPAPPVPAPTSPAGFQGELEKSVHERVNAIRQEFGLSALSWNAELSTIARGHSSDMLEKNYFSHEDASGCDMSCRADKAHYEWQAIGENIYMMSGYDLDAEEMAASILSGWMNSPGHRANILNAPFTTEGIGVAYKGETVYTTEVLANPRH